MKNRDLDIQSIKDVMEITRVLYRGLRCTDEKKWDERVSYFSAELTIDFGAVKPLQTIKPHDLAAWARLAYASVKTQHMLFNVDVIVDGDTATSNSCGHALHERTDTDDFWHIYARYEHGFLRTADGWKVRRVKMTPVFEQGNPKLLEESYAVASRS